MCQGRPAIHDAIFFYFFYFFKESYNVIASYTEQCGSDKLGEDMKCAVCELHNEIAN